MVRKIKFTLRRLGYRKIKVGHAGTLDPLATGILLVCIGRATKMVDALQAEEKEYVADVMLGATTPATTSTPVDRTFPPNISREKVLAALSSLTRASSFQEPSRLLGQEDRRHAPTSWPAPARGHDARRRSTSTN